MPQDTEATHEVVFDPTKSLRRRLIYTLAIALTPVLALGAATAYLDAKEAIKQRSNELLLVADAAVDGVEQSIDESELLLTLFQDDVGKKNCKAVYDRLKRHLVALSSVIRFNKDGIADCSSNGTSGFEMSHPEWHDILRHESQTFRSDAFFGQTTQDWVFGVYSRVDAPDGSFDGSVSIGLRSQALAGLARSSVVPKGVEVSIVDTDGRVFGSERYSSLNPDWVAQTSLDNVAHMFVLKRNGAPSLDVVIKPVGPRNVFAAISRESPGIWSEFTLQPVTSVGLPLLAFSIALLAAWLAIDGLVLRWLSRLTRTVRVYGAGRYKFKAGSAFDTAPSEIAQLAQAMDLMAADIDERDRELKSALAVRDAAVKEIHHRVKNNLQIVTSFLNLQGRQLKDDQARAAIAAARHRIDALAIVHQTLYQRERLELVSMRPFLTSLMDHLSEALGMKQDGIEMEQNYADMERPADDAIPIALFLVEAVTNATKYAFAGGGGQISIALTQAGDRVQLVIEDSGCGFDTVNPTGSTGLGSKLMTAFARQLSADLSVTSAAGEGTRLVLDMPASSTNA